MTLIDLLIAFIILCVILAAVHILLGFIEIDARLKQLVWLVIFVIILIIILSWVSGGGLDTIDLNGRDRVR